MKSLKSILIYLPLILFSHNPINALPQPQVKEIAAEGNKQSSITAVSQLSHVNYDSWHSQQLRNFNSRYQCLANNPTLERSPEVVTRNYFAVLLYQCLNNIHQDNNKLSQEDSLTIQRLIRDFPLKIITLKKQTQQLEKRTNNLTKQSFSPQVKLEGEAIIALAQVWQNNNDSSLTLGNRIRLDFITSFSDKDQLKIRLQGRNIPEFEEVTDSKMSNLGFDGADENEVEIDELEYQISLTKNTKLNIYGVGGGMGDIIPTVNPLFSGSGDGAISLFGRENPIRRQAEGVAIALSQDLSEQLNFSIGYVSNEANQANQGLFQKPLAAITQLTYLPTQQINLSLTYGYTANNVATGTGSANAENPFPQSNDLTAHSYGGEIAVLILPNFSLGGRVGMIQASTQDLATQANADILTWAIMLGINDLGNEDGLLGLIVGQPPKVIKSSLGEEFEDPDTAYHLEAFYRWQLTDDLAITPGFYQIFNPEHNSEEESILVGTIRTTIEF